MFNVLKPKQSTMLLLTLSDYKHHDPKAVIKKKKKYLSKTEYFKRYGILKLIQEEGYSKLKEPGILVHKKKGDLLLKNNRVSSSYSSQFCALGKFYDEVQL